MGGHCGSLLHFEHRPMSCSSAEGVGMTAGGMDQEAVAVQECWTNSLPNGLTQDLSAPTFPSRN